MKLTHSSFGLFNRLFYDSVIALIYEELYEKRTKCS